MSTSISLLTPVIVGIGEITDRPASLAQGLEPLALMEEALRRAETDAGAALLGALESLDVVNLVSWRYANPPAQLCQRMGLSPGRAAYHSAGGESPLRFIHDAALRIARGEIEVAAVVGAEAQNTATKARRENIELPWTPWASEAVRPKSGIDAIHPVAARLGVRAPVTVYPFYDQASAATWGQTPGEALAESAELWSRYARVAASNPGAWLKKGFTPQEIAAAGPSNRPIAWPYTKLMVANPMVNQGAALILTSYDRARALGIAADRLVFIHGGAAANEPRDFLARDQYRQSHAQNAVLESAARLAGRGFDAMELYSCFPCVPKMARRTLGLSEDFTPTVAGGLTFHGAPLNNYMGHAACAMVRRLREGGGVGLLYGQGEYVTKHHALVVGAAPPASMNPDYSVQAEADRRIRGVPELVEQARGGASVESYTVLYDPQGEPTHGVVILRLDSGGRTMARVDISEPAALERLTSLDESAVGAWGKVSPGGESLQFAFEG